MLTKRIIPCLDVTGGRVVKGTSFVNLRDAGDPVELARFYDAEGADELVFLDITASSDSRNIMVDVVRRVSECVFIPFTVGGGLRSTEDMKSILDAGADKISVNTAAVFSPDIIQQGAKRFGSQCIVLAVDAKKLDNPKTTVGTLGLDGNSRWEVFTHGGRKPTGIDAVRWVKYGVALGAGEILLTSMDADGQKTGYDLGLTRAISEAVGVPVIASGGAGNPEDLYQAVAEGKADAVLASSIFHYGAYCIRQTKEYLARKGVPVRL